MSDVQSIFDKMISSGLYNRENSYMCICLRGAFENGVITYGDYMYAFSCIKKYLGANEGCDVSYVRSLAGILIDNDLPHSFDDTLAIYKDWKSRPVLKESL